MRTIKFRIQTALIIVLTIITVNSLRAQMLIKPDGNETTLNSYAMLQLVANGNHFGFMIPSVNYTSLPAATTAGIKGLLVFVTSGGPSGNDAFYFSDGSAWRKLDVGTTSTQWTTSGSNIYYNTGNVGIGTTTPLHTLDIRGTTGLYNAGGDGDLGDILYIGHTTAVETQKHRVRASTSASNTNNILSFETSNGTVGQWNTNQFVLTGTGNIGIGTTTPYTTLTVGSTDATAKITAGGPNTHLTLAAAGPNGNIYLNAGGVASGNYSTSTRLSVGADGNVGIGTTSPSQKLDVAGNIKITNQSGSVVTPDKIDLGSSFSNGITRDQLKIYLYDGGVGQRYGFGVGSASDIQYHSQVSHDFYVNNTKYFSITASGGSNSSDRRLKRDILPLSKYGLKQVMQLNPVSYIFKADETNTHQVGFIAQEVQQIIPEVVTGKEGDLSKGESLGIVYGNLVPVLTKAIQEQQTEIEDLKSKNKEYEERLSKLERNNQNSVTAGIGGNNLMVFSVIGFGIAGLVMYGFKKRTQ